MDKDYLLLKRAALSRPSGQWSDDDFDVLANGVVVGRIFKANASPVGASWMWTLAFGHHEDRSPTHVLRREFIALLGGAAAAWPLAARTHFFRTELREELRRYGYVEGQNLIFEFQQGHGGPRS
jgi:hypothetical protein